MNKDQKKLYDWLVLNSQLEAMSVIDIYYDMDACADFETIKSRDRLTEKEKDQAIYQAIIERWHDELF
ncbi:hypothetical protein FC65_GL000874 [Ligilactobacillus acidipiscis DSM 15836]|uniref:Uncharacterized protein n=1 Tax=Ligilactobacillus acidipiscis DSM 15836 TaxID=1423716 RepID=A0ABR5PND8_9LACO|nr:hypothetical protein [Ligilactobacillus acidipiscis]KRM31964.1 hypothetical protein FC65_GL000874 [Ligilactobacillus acidipiscis DSM 15836]GAW63082.1 hypothetical protein Lacidipiscis_00264 [Ligilactobacillus acidipiscis]GEN19677.1 hypothetical protein LAC02_29580 [Ligilactobacillus acidipiscis]